MALFGLTTAKPAKLKGETTPITGNIIDTATADFENIVLKESMNRPVLVDFWAPWCGPCKQLTPILEAEVNAANGAVLLAKIDIDANPDLAQAMRVQSVPTVMAFFQGQPVSAFAGARPASDIKNLIAQLIALANSAKPNALDIPAALKQAASFLADNDPRSAQELYIQILSQDEMNVDAYGGLIRTLLAVGAVDQAAAMVQGAPELIAKNPAFVSVKTALELAQGAGAAAKKLKPLLQKVEASPNDRQLRFELAQAQFAGGDKEGAIDNLLAIIKAEQNWNNDAARSELLRFFEALGFADPLSIAGRKKLSRLLFS